LKKHLYLVGYSYGMGGLWDPVLARSEDEILGRYPEVRVFSRPPEWMSDEYFETELHRSTPIDIDAPPSGLFEAVLDDRAHDPQSHEAK
jgi:hypothetical protein